MSFFLQLKLVNMKLIRQFIVLLDPPNPQVCTAPDSGPASACSAWVGLGERVWIIM